MAVALSVIIPAYNAVEYIEACVESIIAGTFHDLEVLLIDDGSTDGTGPLCDRLAEKYTAVRVFHTDNRGLAEARNLGIEHAAGQYIGFADADDTVAPNMFESMVKGMSEDVQLVVCRYLRCQEKETQRMGSPVNAKETVNQAETMERLMKTEYGAFVWNKLFRKEILQAEHIRFPQNCRAIEDLFFTWAYVQHCKKAVFLDVPLYFYIMRSGSIMNTFRQSRTVGSHYVNLPRGWRYCTETVEKLVPALVHEPKARTVMFYQTVLRKLEQPDEEYIREAVDYVRANKSALRRYRWGWKYYLSALCLIVSYPLWAKIFRRGLAA